MERGVDWMIYYSEEIVPVTGRDECCLRYVSCCPVVFCNLLVCSDHWQLAPCMAYGKYDLSRVISED
jgi:hypothetical protein